MSLRVQILKKFESQIDNLILVADPDNLILEEQILKEFQEKGFELFSYEDPIAFRYVYESGFRLYWDRGEKTDSKIIIRIFSNDFSVLPYDLLQIGQKISISLGDLFPNLSYSVISVLDVSDLEVLFEAQEKFSPEKLGETATKDFVLRHVFEIAPELVKRPSDLLKELLRRHYSGRKIPELLDDYFIQILRKNKQFKNWPLETIIPDREAFFAFVQEKWKVYLDILAKEPREPKNSSEDFKASYGTSSSEMLLPFEHNDIRVYIDNLFVEGYLQPVPVENVEKFTDSWAICGIQISPEKNLFSRVEKLMDSLKRSIPSEEVKHKEWFQFAYRWSELLVLLGELYNKVPQEVLNKYENIKPVVDSKFTSWILDRFGSLVNLPPTKPVMVHHIPKYLSRFLEMEHDKKIALIVIDGLSLAQWLVIKENLEEQNKTLIFRENEAFAWIPSITSVSRQAIFSGKAPLYFPNNLHSTEKESYLWTHFWIEQGLRANEIAYIKNLGEGNFEQVNELLSNPQLRVIGLVIDKVDNIMHGMELGNAGMHNQIEQWARMGFMKELIHLLHKYCFEIFITSDHGNIEAKGIGRPSEGSLAESRGERVRIFSDKRLRTHVKKNIDLNIKAAMPSEFPATLQENNILHQTIEWAPIGLPDDYLALLAPGRTAFVRKDKITVSHGGISVEELVVPFVKIDRGN